MAAFAYKEFSGTFKILFKTSKFVFLLNFIFYLVFPLKNFPVHQVLERIKPKLFRMAYTELHGLYSIQETTLANVDVGMPAILTPGKDSISNVCYTAFHCVKGSFFQLLM